MVNSQAEQGIAVAFFDARKALQRAEDVATVALSKDQEEIYSNVAEEKIREAARRAEESDQARTVMELKAHKLEEKLAKKRGEIKQLTVGIQDLVDKYASKLESKRQEITELHGVVGKLQAKVAKLETRKGTVGSAKKVQVASESSSPERTKQKAKVAMKRSVSSNSDDRKKGANKIKSIDKEANGGDKNNEEGHQTRGRSTSAVRRKKTQDREASSESRNGVPRVTVEKNRLFQTQMRGVLRGSTQNGKRRPDSSSDSERGDAKKRSRSSSSEARRKSRSASRLRSPGNRTSPIGARELYRAARSRSRGSRSGSRKRPRSSASRSRSVPRKGKGGGKDMGLCFPYVTGKCVRGDACWFFHPPEETCKPLLESLRRKPCKFGVECRRPECLFNHPEGRQIQRRDSSPR